MSVRSILKGVAGWFGVGRKQAARPGARRASLAVEGLEERDAPISLGGSPAAAFLSSGGNFGALNPAYVQPAYTPSGSYYGQPSYSFAPMVPSSLGSQSWVATRFGGPISNPPVPSSFGGYGNSVSFQTLAGSSYGYVDPKASYYQGRALQALAATGNPLQSQFSGLRTPSALDYAALNGRTPSGAPTPYAYNNPVHFAWDNGGMPGGAGMYVP